MINSFGDSTPLPSVMTEGFSPPYAGPVWEGSYVDIDTRYEGEPKSDVNTPFFTTVTGDSPSRDYRIKPGIARDKWTGSEISITGLDVDSSMDSDTFIWINFPVTEGVASGGAVTTGSSFPGEIITTGSGDDIEQTDLNVLVLEIVDDLPRQVLNGNIRLFNTPIASYITVVAFPST